MTFHGLVAHFASMLENAPIVWMDHSFFTHPPAAEHLGYFQFWANMSKAAINRLTSCLVTVLVACGGSSLTLKRHLYGPKFGGHRAPRAVRGQRGCRELSEKGSRPAQDTSGHLKEPPPGIVPSPSPLRSEQKPRKTTGHWSGVFHSGEKAGDPSGPDSRTRQHFSCGNTILLVSPDGWPKGRGSGSFIAPHSSLPTECRPGAGEG